MMAQTTYEVKLALDGAHSVSVRSADPVQMKLAIAWAKATYEALVARYGDRSANSQNPPAESPICAVHEIPMVRVEGNSGPFFSCHERDDAGRFCSYRPSNGV